MNYAEWNLEWTNPHKIAQEWSIYLFNSNHYTSTITILARQNGLSVRCTENPCVPGSIPGGTTH